ncbi:DNA mismatch repair protein MutT [Novimethylophilus kurashikiensis]|uniref:U8 snoRNA-decapping enzyme n=1 Tax=Novimethylophilus kurashikiensis TaxID=1825523 RepID=A0A2R5F892_9PROT|nr:NUDIX domain-containing protein [Novimethylophilus kurashikiensis]GBG14462.1 DNA mismatch repair protein MutT [Novimethylophilus kurashikiensis]
MTIQKIEAGALHPQGKDAVFLWLYCLDGQPYTKRLPNQVAGGQYPMVLSLLRWDGSFGTMGGKVDPGESLYEALCREAVEEASFEIGHDDDVRPLATYLDDEWHMHSYCLELPYSRLEAARESASMVGRSPEVAGAVIVPAFNYPARMNGAPRGRDAFLTMNFFSTSKVELNELFGRMQSQELACG